MAFTINPLGRPFDIKGTGGSPSTSTDNFSYSTVIPSKILTIPENEMMLLKGPFTNLGIVHNYGIISFVRDEPYQMGHWNPIPAAEVVFIPENRVMFFKSILRVYGILRNNGTVEAA